MSNLNSRPSAKRVILDVIKWLYGISCIITGILISIFASFLGGLLIMMAGILIIPIISKKIRPKISLWKERAVRIIVPLMFLIFGFIISGIQGIGGSSGNNHNKIINQFVRENKDKPFLKNLKFLGELEHILKPVKDGNRWYYFELNSDDYLPLDTLKDGSVRYGLYLERDKNKTLSTEKFINPIEPYGQLKKYFVVFTVNKENKLENTVVIFENDKNEVYEITDLNFDISQYADSEAIRIRREKFDSELDEIRQKEAEEEYKSQLTKKKAEWESNCISSWDGSCTKLVRAFKPHLKDPDSFEHIDTGFRRYDDYVLVVMKYRAKNSFGAFDVGTVTAKVNYDCEVLEIVQ